MMYKDEIAKAMEYLAEDDRVVFLGQEIITNRFYKTMVNVPEEKMIEMPIMEDAQLGLSTGLALGGFLPVSLYTRMDFFLLTMNQLVNHLDKIDSMSHGDFKPKVIIRTVVGEDRPLDPGPQHTQDFTEMLRSVLKTIDVHNLLSVNDILPAYFRAIASDRSSILVDHRNLYSSEV